MKRKGIQLADNGDLDVRDGQMAFGDTLAQNEYLLLISHPGDLKENPLLGVGIADMSGDNDIVGWKRRIREALASDGLKVSNIVVTNDGKIERLEADY